MTQLNPFNFLFGETLKSNEQPPVDMSDAQEQKKILSALIQKFEQPQKRPTSIVYDPILGISKIFKLPAQEQKKQESRWKKLTKVLTCSCIQNKYQKSYNMIAVLFCSLKNEQYDWLERNYRKYDKNQLQQLKPEYVQKMKSSFDQVRSQVLNDKVHNDIKQTALANLQQLQALYRSIERKKQKVFKFDLHKEKTHVFTMMISAFDVFSKNYNTYQRAKLKRLFQQIQNQSRSVSSSVEVLRFLQNKDPVIVKLESFDQATLDWQVGEHIAEYMKLSRLQTEATNIGLVKVSESKKRRKVVNILVSGFLSEDQDKKQQWNQLLACMPDSQVYGLQWQSNTITRLVKFLILSIKDLILGKTVQDLCKKDNPFIPAFQVSIHAGEILAYVVHKMFPYQFINIIGYSLGSELIRSFIDKSIELNGGANLNKVISMGGVSDTQEFQNTLKRTKQTINILNCRSKHDSILKYVLKRAKPNITPMGLHDIQSVQNHLVNNIDLSTKINGHFAYMTNFGTVAEHLMLNEE